MIKTILKIIKYFFIGMLVLGVIGAIFGRSDVSDNKTSSSNSNVVTNDNKTGDQTNKESNEESNVVEQVETIEYETVSLAELMDLLNKNSLKAQDTYKGKYLEITGELSTIDASGKYFSLVPGVEMFEITGAHCNIKNDEQKNQVSKMIVGDTVTLKGKCTDVGEVLGYDIDVIEIDGYDTVPATVSSSSNEPISVDAQQLVDDLKNNALLAKNNYKDRQLSVYGRLSNIDSDGKYISIEPSNDPYSFTSISCYIKSDDVKNVVMDLNVGDLITVNGKCTDVGEFLGYSINIDSIER